MVRFRIKNTSDGPLLAAGLIVLTAVLLFRLAGAGAFYWILTIVWPRIGALQDAAGNPPGYRRDRIQQIVCE